MQDHLKRKSWGFLHWRGCSAIFSRAATMHTLAGSGSLRCPCPPSTSYQLSGHTSNTIVPASLHCCHLRSRSTQLVHGSRFKELSTRFDPLQQPTADPELLPQPVEDDGAELSLQNAWPIQSSHNMVPPAYWRNLPPVTASVRNSAARHAVLSPVAFDDILSRLRRTSSHSNDADDSKEEVGFRRLPQIAVPAIAAPLPAEETFHVALERNYSAQWIPSYEPGPDGERQWRWGRWELLADPSLPRYFYYQGMEAMSFSKPQRVWQAVVAVMYICALAAAAVATFQLHPLLFVAAATHWLQGSLTILTCAALAVFTYYDKLWLYAMLVLGKRLDEVFEKHLPPVRMFFVANAMIWVAYLLLAPSSWTVLPFWPFS